MSIADANFELGILNYELFSASPVEEFWILSLELGIILGLRLRLWIDEFWVEQFKIEQFLIGVAD